MSIIITTALVTKAEATRTVKNWSFLSVEMNFFLLILFSS